ncbi:MAG: methyltransferase type 11 [Bacteroidetes bacterium GWF2_42_66]|nr:MAG: methyltransferase type 11 [Bacteroidetes bacterium GWE2_42_39]OFY44932.1 MAG: methyltransferase type 11 [Bacteroidetes bacterium GWF2_42_66]HBL76062.1 SAM-dependent methyltransferase [Prolixibacteraceae bacterium]HCU62178.1 SAM-dependent methyltransferase [Prolixibacteraceae bacterium]
MTEIKYVHGYSTREATRLNDQADTLDDIIHNDSLFAEDSLVLEAGCGVGAQTKIIATKNLRTNFISVDISEESVNQARASIGEMGIKNVEFRQADIFNLPFKAELFDSVIVCFVLEHLHDPAKALIELKRVLKKGGSIMVIEGDHGSTFFYPDSKYAHLAIDCQVQLQKQNGGNSNIGRELYPLLKSAGFSDVIVSPRMVYVDSSRPQLVEGFIKNTFTAMIEGIENDSVQKGLIDRQSFGKGIQDLYRTAEPDGVFSYTFFKGFGTK